MDDRGPAHVFVCCHLPEAIVRRTDSPVKSVLSSRGGLSAVKAACLVLAGAAVAAGLSEALYQDQLRAGESRGIFILTGSAVVGLALGGTWMLLARRRTQLELQRSEESLAITLITLDSIGDGVLATDTAGRVTRLNPVAERLTGWTQAEARGKPVAEVFRIVHEETRAPAPVPVEAVLATGGIQGLANHTALIARNGAECAITHSAAPIRDRDGRILGVVLVFRDVSLERAAQKARQESEARYRTLFNSIDEGFCVIEMIFDEQGEPVDYVFVEVNAAFARQTGLHDAQGKRMRELAPGHEAHWFETYGRIAMTGEPVRFQNRAEQLHRTYDVYAFRFGDARDRRVGILFNDITQRKKAEEELGRFFSLSLDFLCISGPDGGFRRVSPGVTAMLGWSVEEFLAMPHLRLVHPDDVLATLREVERQRRDGEQVVNFENRYRHKDGSWRVLSWRSVPDWDSGLTYATARDVTERKRSEAQREQANAELSRSRAELRSLFESLPGLYLVLTPDFRIVTASDAYLRATLTKREAIAGRDLFDVFPDNPGDPAADGVRNLRASLERVRERRAPDTMAIQRYDVRRPDGSFEERYWSPINSPLLGDDSQLRYIIHRVEDVTAFMRRDQASDPGAAELQLRLQSMEAEVFQSAQRVQAANQQLEAANKELEAFSYSVSHDLRAPLRHIEGYVEMLTREAQDGLSEKAHRYLRTIADAGREMGVLIDDLLAFSRMGRTEMVEQEVDLAALIADVRRGLGYVAPDRNIHWLVEPLPRVRGDAAMLRQVLVNLLGNAIKYTRGRDPAEIAVGILGREEERLILFVRDNGAGFDMRYANKLFGVFQRLHRADEFEGTGIGLASVRRIVARHGGRTWAEGRLNAGATFYFTLKPAEVPADATPATHEAQTHPAR